MSYISSNETFTFLLKCDIIFHLVSCYLKIVHLCYIIAFSKTIFDNMEKMKAVLALLRKSSTTLMFCKFSFLEDRVQYLSPILIQAFFHIASKMHISIQ